MNNLLLFASITIPIQLLFQLDLPLSLLRHPTSLLVRTYGFTTFAMHWAWLMLLIVLVTHLLRARKARVIAATILTCLASVYYQLDWWVYRCVHQHALGFVRGGLLNQPDAVANTGLNAASFALPIAMLIFSCLVYVALARLCTAHRLSTFVLWPRRKVMLLGTVAVALFVLDRTAYVLYVLRGNYRVIEYTESIPCYLLAPTRALLEHLDPRAQELSQLTEWVHEGVTPRRVPIDYPRELATSAPQRRPHVIFLVYESWRHDAIQAETMPALHEFSAQSTCFANHYSNAPTTHFGLFALQYSLYPSAWWQIQHDRAPPLPVSILRSKGYRTCALSTGTLDWYHMRDFIFNQAFDLVDDSQQVTLRDRSQPGTGHTADLEAVYRLLAELHRSKEPFFGFLFINSTHFPYFYPKEFEVETPVFDPSSPSMLDFAADADRIRRRYRNCLRWADYLFRELVRGLDLENTILVVTGDHGEQMGEDGKFGHASGFEEGQLHVPLVIHAPGQPPANHAELTSHVDVFPTVLDLLGVRPAQADQQWPWPGRSALQQPRPFFLAGNANVYSPMPTAFAVVDRDTKVWCEIIAGHLRVIKVTDHLDQPIAHPLQHAQLPRVVANVQTIMRENDFANQFSERQ